VHRFRGFRNPVLDLAATYLSTMYTISLFTTAVLMKKTKYFMMFTTFFTEATLIELAYYYFFRTLPCYGKSIIKSFILLMIFMAIVVLLHYFYYRFYNPNFLDKYNTPYNFRTAGFNYFNAFITTIGLWFVFRLSFIFQFANFYFSLLISFVIGLIYTYAFGYLWDKFENGKDYILDKKEMKIIRKVIKSNNES